MYPQGTWLWDMTDGACSREYSSVLVELLIVHGSSYPNLLCLLFLAALLPEAVISRGKSRD